MRNFLLVLLIFIYCFNLAIRVQAQEISLKSENKNLRPLYQEDFEITIEDFNQKISVIVADANNFIYFQEDLAIGTNGKYSFSLIPKGKAGDHIIRIESDGKVLGQFKRNMLADTYIETDNNSFNELFKLYKDTIVKGQSSHFLNDIRFKVSFIWLRDHIHMLKAFKYFESDLQSALDFFISTQDEDGFFYEIIVSSNDVHVSYVSERYVKPMNKSTSLLKLEIEADIEYLMAEAFYQVWKATGDLDWVRNNIASIDKGLRYYLDSPIRYDEGTGLIKRGVSIDTWDWIYGQRGKDHNRMLEDGSPLAIFHGDNTGFYQACIFLSEMYAAIDNGQKANEWADIAKDTKEKLMALAWNGDFFSHMVHIDPTVEELTDSLWIKDFEGDKDRLSLSNTYALNRGILSQEEASKIIETYRNIRDYPPPSEVYKDSRYFAEWLTLYPSYRNVSAIIYPPNDYVNGTISLFVAGELAKGAFNYGYTEYGNDILTRVRGLYEKDGTLHFLYRQNGDPYLPAGGGGPSGWSTAALFSATVEGYAGAFDLGNQFEKVRLSPTWSISDYDDVYTSISYGPSDKYLAYKASHNKEEKEISYQLSGDSKEIDFQVLVPKGNIATKVLINDKEVDFKGMAIHDSIYATFRMERESNLDIDTIKVFYKEGSLPKEKKAINPLIWIISALAVLLLAGSLFFFRKKKA